MFVSVSFGAMLYVQHEELSKNMFDHLVDDKATLELSKKEREFIKRLIQPSPTDCSSLVRTPYITLDLLFTDMQRTYILTI